MLGDAWTPPEDVRMRGPPPMSTSRFGDSSERPRLTASGETSPARPPRSGDR
jgi:hypothetical protein